MNQNFVQGAFVLLNDPASAGVVYKVVSRNGDYFKLKSKNGTRFCKLWRIERLATAFEMRESYYV